MKSNFKKEFQAKKSVKFINIKEEEEKEEKNTRNKV